MFETNFKMDESQIANLASVVFNRVQKDFYEAKEATEAYLEIYRELKKEFGSSE